MKVWLVNHYALPPSEVGGTRHYALAKGLIAAGWDVTIVASSFDHFARREARLAPGEEFKLETLEGVPFLWLRTPPYPGNTLARFWNMAAFGRTLWRTADRLPLARPDVIVGSSPHLFAALAAERLAARYGVPFVLEVRDLWPQSLIDLTGLAPWHPAILLLGAIERRLYRRAARILSLLPGAAGHMVAKGASPENVVWLPNGVEPSLLPAEVAPPTPGRPFTAMFAGAHGVANGLDAILDAAKLLEAEGHSEIRIRLIGQGPEKARLQARAAAEGISLVTFDDPVPKAEVYGVMAEADAFLMVLKDSPVFRWGVSPNKLFDYLASARPVIFGVSTPFNPVAEAEAGFTIPPEDPRALADALVRLAAVPAEERWQMGLRGRKAVLEQHSLDRLAARLDAVLRELCLPALGRGARQGGAGSLEGLPAHRCAEPAPGRADMVPRGVKRLLDVMVAATLLVLLAPVMLAVAAWIRVVTGGPALFTQDRPGLHGKVFKVYKFRSMTNDRDDAGELLPDAQRLKPWGQALRRLSLDELPQLWNVLRGELSLVGPRPLLVKYLPLYTPEQARRHEVPPGITGWAQVNGRNAIGWEERFALDVWYVDHWSLGLDLKILAMTAAKVLRRSDVSAAGHVTMPEFAGTQEEAACASPSTAPADTAK